MPRARRRRVIWSPEADKDMLDIWAYYARVASPEIADNLLREIDRIGDGIGENPLLSRQRDDLLPGLRSFIVRPHVIFFRIGDGAVEVVRVLHGRRDFPTIFGREGR
jgi:toxin ParE1/3/4